MLTSAQASAMDLQISQALDGVNGGHYTLGTILEIDGAGLALEGTNNQVTGTLTVNSGGHLTFAAGSLITSNATHVGAWTFGDGASGVGHAATVTIAANSSLVITGVTTANGNITANNSTWALVATIVNMSGAGQINLAGTSSLAIGATAGIVNSGTVSMASGSHLDFASTADVTGTAAWKGVLTLTNAGHIASRYQNSGPDADTTFTINDYDCIQVPTLTANRTYKLANTGATKGCMIVISMFNESGAFVLTVLRDDNTTLDTIQNTGGSTVTEWFIYDGSNWKVFTRVKL